MQGEFRLGTYLGLKGGGTYLLQDTLHDLWPVVHSEHDISDTNSCQCLNLVHDHGLVGELHQGLGHGKSLHDVVSGF